MVSSFHNGAKLTFLKHDTVHIKKIFSVRYSTKHSQSLLNLGLNRKLKKKNHKDYTSLVCAAGSEI